VTGRHAGLRTECILRLLDVVSQKEVAARDAHLSHASGGSAGKNHLLHQLRHSRVRVLQRHVKATTSAEMDAVRDECLFCDRLSFHLYDPVRTETPSRSGSG
jgi:hypothetical protein